MGSFHSTEAPINRSHQVIREVNQDLKDERKPYYTKEEIKRHYNHVCGIYSGKIWSRTDNVPRELGLACPRVRKYLIDDEE